MSVSFQETTVTVAPWKPLKPYYVTGRRGIQNVEQIIEKKNR